MSRQAGYRVTIRGFLPADRKSLADTHKAVNLIMSAQTDPAKRGELADALTSVTVDVRTTSIEIEPDASK